LLFDYYPPEYPRNGRCLALALDTHKIAGAIAEGRMSDERRYQGGCACGEVRYELRGEPISINNCHCTECQLETGSTSVVNAFIEADRLSLLSGKLSEHSAKTGSGRPHVIVRCANCGTAMWSHYAGFGRLGAGVRLGTLDNRANFRPQAAIFTNERMPWVTLPEGIPSFEKYYDPKALLSAESLARMESLAERRKAGEG
jgi:hypothetical protein